MPTFQYKARNTAGEIQSGTIDGINRTGAVRKLSNLGLIPLELAATRKGDPNAFSFELPDFSKPQIETFTRQLAILVDAGVPVVEALKTLETQTENFAFRQVLRDILSRVLGGTNLSSSFEQSPKYFSPVYVAMLRAGEATGNLHSALRRISELLGNEKETSRKISDGLRYPLLVMAALTVASTVIVFFVIPRFGEFFTRARVPHPLPTRVMISISHIALKFGWLLLLAVIGVPIALRRYLSTSQGRLNVDKGILTLPTIGSFIRSMEAARFTRNLSILLGAGVHLPEGLRIMRKVTGNTYLQNEIRQMELQVVEGKGLTSSKALHELVPPAVATMIAIGEQSSRLPEVLLSAAQFLEDEVSHRLGEILARLEPLLILMVGMGIAFLAFSVFLPMWNMLSIIQHQ